VSSWRIALKKPEEGHVEAIGGGEGEEEEEEEDEDEPKKNPSQQVEMLWSFLSYSNFQKFSIVLCVCVCM